MHTAPTNETRGQSLERFANRILHFSAVLLAGYFVCCVVAVILFERAYRKGPNDMDTLEALIVTAGLLIVVGILPMGITVIAGSILSVLMRKRSWRVHLAAVIAACLLVPVFLGVIFTMEGDRGLLHLLFVPALSSAIVIVWVTRKLYRATPSS